MTNSITTILGKKGKLTGAEVGNLVIKQIVYQLKNRTDRGLFSKGELETASNSLTDANEIKAFNKRVSIANFLDEMLSKGNYADLLISQKTLAITTALDKIKLSLDFIGQGGQPLRFTYKEYENYRTEKLNAFFADNKGDKKTTLFNLLLQAIKDLDREDKEVESLIDRYEGKPLTDKEKSIFSSEYKEKSRSPLDTDKIKQLLIEESNYKEVIAYLAECDNSEGDLFSDTTTEKEPYTKADFVYSLSDYWEASDKTDTTFKDIITEYKELLTVVKDKLDKEHFKGELAKVKLGDTLKKEYSLRELQDTYGYSFIGEALENKPVLITEYGQEQTPYDKAETEVEVFKKILTKDSLLTPLAVLEETIVFITNINLMFDILAEETGVDDIKDLKFEIKPYKETMNTIYQLLTGEYLGLKAREATGDEVEYIKTAFRSLGNLVIESKDATETRINRAKELLRSQKNFRDYQNEFFYIVLGKL